MALVHVTYVDIDKKEIAISDMWKVPLGFDIRAFQDEIRVTAAILAKPFHPMERKLDEFDTTLQGLLEPSTKRIHTAFGDEATLLSA